MRFSMRLAAVARGALLLALALSAASSPADAQLHHRSKRPQARAIMRYRPLFGGEYQSDVGKNASIWAQELARQHSKARDSAAVLGRLRPAGRCPPGHSLADLGPPGQQLMVCRPDKEPDSCMAFIAAEGATATAAARALLSGSSCRVHTFACGASGSGPSLDPDRHFTQDVCLGAHVSGQSLPYHMARTWLGRDVSVLIAETRGHQALRLLDTWRLDDADLPSQVVLLLRQGWHMGSPEAGNRAAAEELRLVLHLARSGYALVHRRDASSSSSSSSNSSADSSSAGGSSSRARSLLTAANNDLPTARRRGLAAWQWRRGSAADAVPADDPNLGLPVQLTFVRVSVPHIRTLAASVAAQQPWHTPLSGETAESIAAAEDPTLPNIEVVPPPITLEALQQAASALRTSAADGSAGGQSDVWKQVWRLAQWMGDATNRGPAGFRCDHVADPSVPMTPRFSGAKYLLAMNLRNNAPVAPHLFSELLKAVMMLPPEDVYVSVYESSSIDNTPAWLSLLADALSTLGVHHTIIAGGPEKLADDGDRIAFLAAVRNAALRPLLPAASRQPISSFSPAAQLVIDTWRHQAAGWRADYIVFVNDVYACAHDILRLVQHDADIACGMDFDRCCGKKRRRAARLRRRLQQAGASSSDAQDGAGGYDASVEALLHSSLHSSGGAVAEGSSASFSRSTVHDGIGGHDASIDALWQAHALSSGSSSSSSSSNSGGGSSSSQDSDSGSDAHVDALLQSGLAAAEAQAVELAAQASELLDFEQLAGSYAAAAAQEAADYSYDDDGGDDYDEHASDEGTRDDYWQQQQQQQQQEQQQQQRSKEQQLPWLQQQQQRERRRRQQLPARALLRAFPTDIGPGAAGAAEAAAAAAAQAPCPEPQADLSHVAPEFRDYNTSKFTEWDARPHRKYYDTWVGRDRSGRRILKSPPFVSDAPSIARLARGLPVAVRSCWNGLVVLRAAPFLEHGVRFRTALYDQGECGSSECTLLADDFWRLGYRRFIMDPSIRLTYDVTHAAAVWTQATIQMLPLKPTPWPVVERAMVSEEGRGSWAQPLEERRRECCNLKPGTRAVPFDKCEMRDFLATNYTALALQQRSSS